MGKSFSVKLALNNIKNNRKFYLPYTLAAVGIIAMFYIMCFMAFNPGTEALSVNLAFIMILGTVVVGIFAFIFLFYTNSFLMKRRKKEIGLYNILGMEKKHIGKILAIENLMISTFSIFIGLISGILFSKLVYLIICWMFGTKPPIGFEVSMKGILITIILFGVIFLLTLIGNQMSIHLAKPIELLHGGETGEKEPKTKGTLAVLGVLCLGIGYYIAITTESPLTAIFLFFIAVVLVIIGTYCLFTAGSIAVLKALRGKKSFFYKPGNFTAVSGMIYRMKQNAVGLANICILSTMVLVMISGTVSLYVGTNDALNSRFAGDVSVSAEALQGEQLDREQVIKVMKEECKAANVNVKRAVDYEYLYFNGINEGDNFKIEPSNDGDAGDTTMLVFITQDAYNRLTGNALALEKNEVASFSKYFDLGKEFFLEDMKFTVKEKLDEFVAVGNLDAYLTDSQYIVVGDMDVLNNIDQRQQAVRGESANEIAIQFALDMEGTDEEKVAVYHQITDKLSNVDFNQGSSLLVESKQYEGEFYYSLIAGFLFLGIFLGLIFTFAAALIIYYKQISEGYYDKEKFEIMQKVGMSKEEVKKTIKRQVLMVFFIPLIVAGIHVAAAFNLIRRLLLIFSLNNVGLFAVCTVVTFLAFAVIYAVVYAVTAREYYKIVGNL